MYSALVRTVVVLSGFLATNLSAYTYYIHSCTNCLARVTVQLPMTPDECRASGQTFSMPLKVKVQLISWDVDTEGTRVVRDIKEQDIYFADIPCMIDLYEENGRYLLGSLGTFVINGVDRVIVSQLHRSPGVVFSQSKKVKDTRGKAYYLARIIPMRGSWIDFEFDSSDHLYVRIDKKKKLLATTFLQALGVKREEIIPLFYKFDTLTVGKDGFMQPLSPAVIGVRYERGMADIDDEQYVGKRITKEMLTRFEKLGVKHFTIRSSSLVNRVLGVDIVDPRTGEILAEQGERV